MSTPEQIQKDIEELPEEAQSLLVDFIEILKKRYPRSAKQTANSEESPYQKFKQSGLIGFVSVEEDLSTTYKQALSKKLATKYDHH
jgi:mRNA-degrading endonuclease RelE of RelBE toxin-antitoxin system